MEERDLTGEAALLAEKEEWAAKAARTLVEERIHPSISFEIAIAAARCASIWIDDLKEVIAGGEVTDLKAALEQSRQSALEKSQDIERFPSGVPTIMTMMVLHEAFLRAFEPDERERLRGLLYAEETGG